MKRRIVTALVAACAACAAEWPLVIVRYAGAANGDLPAFKRLMALHGEFPGACDAVWLCAGGIKTIDGVAADCAAFASYRAACESNGVVLAYQQGPFCPWNLCLFPM